MGVLTERLMKVTVGKFGKEQGCVDQIFAIKRMVKDYLECLGEGEKSYDKVD